MKKFFALIFAAVLLLSGCGADKVANAPESNAGGSSASDSSDKGSDEFDVNNIDWNAAPKFNNKADLVHYLRTSKENLQTYLPAVFTDGLALNIDELTSLATIWYVEYTNYNTNDPNTTNVLFKIGNYPGERVAYAYLNNDTSFLSDEEKQLYKEAVEIVNEAKEFSKGHSSPELYQELYIHDIITERATYYTENPQPLQSRFQTAIGALIDGKANCQGYTDAFYMLAKMCGFNVNRVGGRAANEDHTWNTITFDDGKTYFVDVTWDEASFTFDDTGKYNNYIYFNAPADLTATTHQWNAEFLPNIVQQFDDRYFYYTKEFENSNGQFFGAHADDAKTALDYIAQRIGSDGWEMSWVCAPFDEKLADPNAAINYLVKEALSSKYKWSGEVNLYVVGRGNKYMFFTVHAMPK